MTNHSGKFVSVVSNKETEAVSAAELSQKIPPAPGVSVLQRVERCFGKYWWVWIILLITLKITSK